MKKLLLILLCLPMIGFGQLNIITKVANEELKIYLQKIPLGQEQMFGFNNREEFSQSKIGVPYEVFTLATNFFDNEKIEEGKSYIVSTGNWRIPIVVNNKYKALLTVSKENNKWRIVKIGAKGLARELDKFEQNHPSITDLKILRVFQLKGDFILTSQNLIHPLTSASKGLLIDNDKAYSIYNILNLIKNNNYER
jgi:hypothetical protein